MTKILAIPMEYAGVRFRSTLEADWCAMFDSLRWEWNYEPIALSIGGVGYLPDFWLPNQRVWVEVKGPDDERIHKPARLASVEDDDEDIRRPLVVIARPAMRGSCATWEGARPDMEVVLSRCPECAYVTFIDLNGIWVCRMCWTGQRLKDKSRRWVTDYYRPGELAFTRAPRPDRAA